MMAIFPGFLFRKCYYRGEFTKQFSQSNEFDKLLWNFFFSGICIGITFLSIYIFRSLTGLELLTSLNYETVNEIISPISENKIPEKDVIFKTYKDLIFIVGLIYIFACFFGFTLHWLVRALNLDISFPLFRFKNYWHYYFHGGRILYSNPNNKKLAFTVVDVLCEVNGDTKLYSGILSQYTISRDDNNLENIFLTEARLLKQIKDEDGKTVEVVRRDIPGAAFWIPFKNVANMNLIYVYKNEEGRNTSRLSSNLINVVISLCFTFIIASIWFDLSSYGIKGFWEKFFYLTFTFVCLANIRLLVYNKDWGRYNWIGHILIVISSVLWVLSIMELVPLWPTILMSIVSLVFSALITPSKSNDNNSFPE